MSFNIDIYAKLFETVHLNVPERLSLPGGKISFARLVHAARSLLREDPWLPRGLRNAAAFEGVAIEARGDAYWVHECHEAGISRFGPVSTHRVADLPSAVREWLRANGGTAIDGIEVDYEH